MMVQWEGGIEDIWEGAVSTSPGELQMQVVHRLEGTLESRWIPPKWTWSFKLCDVPVVIRLQNGILLKLRTRPAPPGR